MKKRVLHLLFSDRYGGAEKVAMDIIQYTSRNVESIYLSYKGSIEINLQEKKIPYKLVEHINYVVLKDTIKEFNIDIIHAHDFRASILASFFSKKCVVISHLHQSPKWLTKRNMKTSLYQNRTKYFKKIFVVSKEIKDIYPYNAHQKFEVLNNIVDTPHKIKKSREYDFIFVGRLEAEKGPMSFLKFINQYQKVSKYKVKAVVVGDGSLKKDMMEYSEKNFLDVRFTGFLSSPYDIINQSKFMMVTSVKEGFGIAIVESLQLGVPIITKRIGGVTELLTNKEAIIYDTYGNLINMLDRITNEYYENLCKNAIFFGNEYRVSKNLKIKEIYNDI